MPAELVADLTEHLRREQEVEENRQAALVLYVQEQQFVASEEARALWDTSDQTGSGEDWWTTSWWQGGDWSHSGQASTNDDRRCSVILDMRYHKCKTYHHHHHS